MQLAAQTDRQTSTVLLLADDQLFAQGFQATSHARHSPAQPSPAQPSPAQPSPAQQPIWGGPDQTRPAQHSTAQHSTAQHSTAQHSTAQHSAAQHSTAQLTSVAAAFSLSELCSMLSASIEMHSNLVDLPLVCCDKTYSLRTGHIKDIKMMSESLPTMT